MLESLPRARVLVASRIPFMSACRGRADYECLLLVLLIFILLLLVVVLLCRHVRMNKHACVYLVRVYI